MDALPISMPREAIASFCGRNHIQKLSVFGSALTSRFRDQSDIDLLVEFQPGYTPGLLGISRMETELSGMLGRKVDLRTPRDLSRHFRNDVLASAVLQYEANSSTRISISTPISSGAPQPWICRR